MNAVFLNNKNALIKYTGMLLALLFYVHTIQAQVVVTSAGNVDMCVGGAYKTIPDFKIAEKLNNDFAASGSLQTYELNAPNNFEFNPGVGTITTPSSTDIAFAYLSITATKITLNYFLNATAQKDSFIFKNIQVRAVGTNSSNDLRFTGGTASQNQNNQNQYVHAHFNSAQSGVSFTLPSSTCINGGNINLSGTPGGGTFSGTGVSGNTFNPFSAGEGTFVITYTATNNGCTSSPTATIIVKPAPSVTFFGLNDSYCSNESIVTLSGFPTGGVFSGTGVSGLNFSPQSVPNPPATVDITYTYTNPITNCSASFTKSNVSIKTAPTNVTLTLNPSKTNYSSIEDSVLIDGSYSQFANPSTLPTGAFVTVTGNGVSTGIDGRSRFFPNVVGQGNSTIVRRVTTSNGCYAEASTTVAIAQSNSNTIGGVGSSYCTSSSNVSLTVNGGVGVYTCKVIIGGIFEIDVTSLMIDDYIENGLGTFKPSEAPYLNQTYRIIFTDKNDITKSGYTTTFIKSNIIPKISYAPTDSSQSNILCGKYCSGDNDVNLSATPVGGAFGIVDGPSSAVTGTKFKPSILSLGDTVKVTYTYADGQGCGGTDTAVVIVKASENNLSFSGLENFCGNDTIPKLLQGTPIGGYFRGTGIVDSLGIFKASVAVESNNQNVNSYPIRYFYTNSKKCTSTTQQLVQISKSPDVNFTGLNPLAKYCKSDSEVELFSNLNPGTYTLINSIGDTIPNGINNGKFNPQLIDADNYKIVYSYTDQSTNCSSSKTKNFVIHKLPEVSLSNLSEKYCEKDPAVQLSLSPSITSTSGTGVLTSTTSAAISGSMFLPLSSAVKKHKLTYTFTNEFGCVNSHTDSTIVYGKPVIDFTISTRCVGDTIVFEDLNSDVNDDPAAYSYIDLNLNKWDIDNNITIKDTIHRVLTLGTHVFKYTVSTNQGCSTTKDSTIFIGPYPTIGFSWDNVCNADNTEFENSTFIPEGNDSWIDTVRWDLGDNTKMNLKAMDQTPSTNFWNVNHTYLDYGIYNVTQTAITNLNCVSVDSQKVYILPSEVVTPSDPYSNDFEVDEGGWVSSGIYDAASTWNWGVAEQTVINTTSTNDHVWVTGLDVPNNPDEISYVYSPCFNLSALTKPMIRMDIWKGMDTIPNYSGAVLQYSADGVIWRKVGDRSGEGISWYNNTGNINSKPNGNFELNQDGWTGMDSLGWDNARHVLDDVIIAAGTNNLRFRIAFAASNTPYNGFAFDDVWIGERSKFMLTEHFTSNSSTLAVAENNYINNKTTTYSKDMVQLQYHTGFAGPDQMFSRNVSDPGARALYYGISQVPASTLDGSYYNGNTSGVNDRRLRSRVLEDPQFSIDIVPDLFNPASQNVSGNVVVQSKIPVSNNVTLQIAILERFVNNVTGQNGETSYQWVHSQFLPDAAGKSFAANWNINQTETVPFTWNFTSSTIYNPDKLAIIAFVQDNVTKEIYQAAYKGLGATVATGVFDPAETTSTVTLYPNPANDITTVILNGKLAGEYTWVIIDELGRTVGEGTLTDGTDGFAINTQNYASGFYTLRLSNGSDGVKTQKFVVVH